MPPLMNPKRDVLIVLPGKRVTLLPLLTVGMSAEDASQPPVSEEILLRWVYLPLRRSSTISYVEFLLWTVSGL